jgi:phosphoribosylformylglycinamidine (FGAM) synthase-like amidotransferase family enzyme
VFVELVGALRLYLVGVGGVSSVRDDAEVFLDGEAAVAVSQAASEATGMEWHVEEQNERGFGLAGVRAFVVCDGGSWCDQLRMAGLVAYTEAVR